MISGTSRDGVDAALVEFSDDQPELIEAICVPYPSALAQELNRLVTGGQRPGQQALDHLDTQLADHFSLTVRMLLDKAGVSERDVTAIGSHGQTVWHDPDGKPPESIQLGEPQRIAQQSGIITVGDFRRADIEAGGQGAPLAPLLHRALFAPPTGPGSETRVVLNLGGIANISVIGPEGELSGYDTGPANCLMDTWIRKHRDQAFDQDGAWAAAGQCQTELLSALRSDPYFHLPAPKSTGIEYFNLAWLENFGPFSAGDAQDIQSTLAELTCTTVAEAILPHRPGDVLVCGGGAHNRHLLQRLGGLLPGIAVKSTAEHGLDPDWVEAVLFAWLARERLAERKQDTRRITGARNPVLLGTVARPASNHSTSTE